MNKIYKIFNPTANSPIVIDRSKEGNVFINYDLNRKDSETGNSIPLKNNSGFENNSKASKSSSKSSLTSKSIQSYNSKLSQQKENPYDLNDNQIKNNKKKNDVDLKNLSNNKFKLLTIMKDKDEQLQKKLSDIFIKNNFNNPIKRNNFALSKENPFSLSNRESLQFLNRKNIKDNNKNADRLAGN